MSHYRKLYRDAVASAAASSPALLGYARLKAWDEKIDLETLPCWGVFTDLEASTPTTQNGSKRRVTDLTLVAKIAGGESVEDLIDDLAETLEGLVFNALHAQIFDGAQVSCTLNTLTTSTASGNAQRIGTVALKFNITAERERG